MAGMLLLLTVPWSLPARTMHKEVSGTCTAVWLTRWDVLQRRPVSEVCLSYMCIVFCFAVDDTGHPSVQHKPLAKGPYTQTSLAKVFDDPAMRPRVFCPNTVNKQHFALMTRDIEGNVVSNSRPCSIGACLVAPSCTCTASGPQRSAAPTRPARRRGGVALG